MQNFLFANLPFERGKILFSKGFFVYTVSCGNRYPAAA